MEVVERIPAAVHSHRVADHRDLVHMVLVGRAGRHLGRTVDNHLVGVLADSLLHSHLVAGSLPVADSHHLEVGSHLHSCTADWDLRVKQIKLKHLSSMSLLMHSKT